MAYQVEDVVEKKALIGNKKHYMFEGNKFDTKEEAERQRELRIDQLKKQEAADRAQQEIENVLESKRAEYDKDPIYKTINIKIAYKQTHEGGFIKAYEQSAFIDLEQVTSEINKACRELHINGYEVISIMDVISGVGIERSPRGTTALASYGYSLTDGVIITGKKIMS